MKNKEIIFLRLPLMLSFSNIFNNLGDYYKYKLIADPYE